MYKLLCQLFLAVVGQNLPEEVFEGTLYWLLQGKRKDRQIIDRNVKQISLMTPYQLQIIGWPKEYIVSRTKKGRLKVYSVLICEKFRQMFHTHKEETFSPCHRYIKIWEEGPGHPSGSVGYERTKIKVILYFKSLEDKEKTKKLINTHLGFKNIYEDKILNYKLTARDYSHMCTCSTCSKFMPSHAERLQINDRDPMIFEEHRHFYNSSISNKNDWNHELSQVLICVECLYSKERQDKYRLNMYDHDHFKYGYHVNSPKEREINNLEQSLGVVKPDMKNIPQCEKMKYETPLDYCGGNLRCLLNPHSTFYWHPGLTADEYMRYQEYKMLEYLENADPLDDDNYPEDGYDDYGEYPDE